jgi:hypothetical protein
VGQAELILLDARAMWEAASEALERDIWFFVERGVKESHHLVAGRSAGEWRYRVSPPSG